MYKLHYAPGACSLAVHICLEWIGRPYETQRVDPADPDYARINPAQAVPALEIGTDKALTQGAAILKYLARRYPDADLGAGDSPEEAAELDRWASFLTGDLHPAYFPIFMPQRYTTSTDVDDLARVRDAGVALVRRKLGLMDTHLHGRDYMIGDKRTIVDAYTVPMVRWAKTAVPGGLADFPEVARHHARMLGDPAVRKAMADEGLKI